MAKPCRNGPQCYHLKRGNCWFYHPPSHFGNSSTRSYSIVNPNFYQTGGVQRVIRNLRQLQERQILQRQRQIQWAQRSRQTHRQPFQVVLSRRIVLDNKKNQQTSFEQFDDFKSPIKCSLKDEVKWFFIRNKHVKIQKQGVPEKYQSCSICLQEYEYEQSLEDKHLTELFCKHHFHTPCIETWFEKSDLCPLCKVDFRKHENYAEWDKEYSKRIKQKHKNSLVGFHPLPINHLNSTLWNEISSDQEDEDQLDYDIDETFDPEEDSFDYYLDYDEGF